MSILSEFKEFISKGNVLDLAVGVIIGAAFGKIVSSLTDDMIMPVVGLATGRVGDYSHIMLGPMKVGIFLGAVLNFFIIAFCVFLIVQAANRFRRPTSVVVVPPAPVVSKEQELLTEIRDALRTRAPQQ